MEQRQYFTFYETFLNQLDYLDDTTQLLFYRAIANYGIKDEDPVFSNPLHSAIWQSMKEAIDNQRIKSEVNKERIKKCRENKNVKSNENFIDNVKSSENFTNERNISKISQKNEIYEEEIEIDKEYVNGIEKESEKEITENSDEFSKKSNISKTSKHKKGSYNNVLLSDDEFSKLKETYTTDTEPIINNFSELKAMKGYTYKSDYLAIKKWGAEAFYKTKKSAPPAQASPAINTKKCDCCGAEFTGFECTTCGFPEAYKGDMNLVTGFQLVREKYPKESWRELAGAVFSIDGDNAKVAKIKELLGRANHQV